MHRDDWIAQTNYPAIDIGQVVRVGSLCESFAQEAAQIEPKFTLDIAKVHTTSHLLECVVDYYTAIINIANTYISTGYN